MVKRSVVFIFAFLVVCFALPVAAAIAPVAVYVDASYTAGSCGGHTWGVDAWNTIPGGISLAGPGATIYVAAGTYTAPIELASVTGISLIGAGAATTIVKPATTIPWNVGAYGSSRQTGVRVVGSTGVLIQGFTFDFDTVKNNFFFGLLLWDTEGTVSNCVIKNTSLPDASGYYYEFGACVRAPSFVGMDYADVTFANNTFTDTGRVGILAHDYVDLTISGNTFAKMGDDFGYAMEIGSTTVGSITGNTIYGYHTPALSDGSGSAGIYIENSFTNGITTSTPKPVTVSGNEIFDCQVAMHIGNEFDGYAGAVPIQVTASNNYFHDNTEGGVVIADQDASDGSSVTVSFSGDTIVDNNDYGVYVYSWGDGDIDADFTQVFITGHAEGLVVWDGAPPAVGTYDVTLTGCDLSGNTDHAVENASLAATVNATGNWWGSANGPTHSSNTYCVGAQGCAVTDRVTFVPWLNSGTDAEPGTPGFQPNCGPYAPVTTSSPAGSYSSIQAAIDAVADSGTVNVDGGTYTEQVIVNKNLTLAGTGGPTITPPATVRSFNYPESGATWEPVVIAYGGTADGSGAITGTGTVAVTVSGLVIDGNDRVPTAGRRSAGLLLRNVVGAINSNTVQDMYVDGAETFGIYVQGASDVTITANTVSGWARGGIGVNGDFGTNGAGPLADPHAHVQGNTVTGPGMGVPVIWAPNGIQFGYGATGGATYNTVSGCGWPGTSWTGSGIVLASTDDVTVAYNSVTGNQTGIAVAGWMWQPDGATANDNFIESNTVQANEYGISVQDKANGTIIWYNTISGNAYDGIDVCNFNGYPAAGTIIVGNAITGNNPTDVADCGGLWVQSGVATVDADGNWWGASSGPYHATLNAGGAGDWIIGNASFEPWYIDSGMTRLSDTLVLTVNVTGNGSVTESPDQATYHYGDVVTLTPVPATGWQFDSWTGAVDGSNQVTLTGDATVGATFTQIDYTLTVDTVGQGSVDRNPDQATYHYGDTVTLTADPVPGYRFTGWTGDYTGTDEILTISAFPAAAVAVTATFVALPPPPPPEGDKGTTDAIDKDTDDGVVTVNVPGSITENPVTLALGPTDDPPPTGGNPSLGIYDVVLTDAESGDDVTELSSSVTITFHYTAATLAAAGVTDPHDLRIWYWDVDATPPCWVALPTVVDEVAMTISTTVDHLTTFAAMADADFPALADAAGHWAEQDILRLASLGVVNGYEDGSFRPEVAVTRAQFAKFIALSLDLVPGQTLPQGFADAAAVQTWAVPYVSACLREGILTGSGGLLRPNDTITRAEAAAMIVRALGLLPAGSADGSGAGGLTFSDAGSVPAWATAYVAEAVAHGLINGLPGNVFDASGTLTRAQAATILSKAMDVEL